MFLRLIIFTFFLVGISATSSNFSEAVFEKKVHHKHSIDYCNNHIVKTPRKEILRGCSKKEVEVNRYCHIFKRCYASGDFTHEHCLTRFRLQVEAWRNQAYINQDPKCETLFTRMLRRLNGEAVDEPFEECVYEEFLGTSFSEPSEFRKRCTPMKVITTSDASRQCWTILFVFSSLHCFL